MRNLNNINGSTFIDSYPIVNQPVEHSVLVYEAPGTFKYEFIAPGGGIIGVFSAGTGQSIIKSILSNILTLKSLKGTNQNILVSSLVDELSFTLNTDLNFSQDQNFHLDDGGSGTLLNLFFRTTYGIFSAIPLQINNQGRIDINGTSYFNSVVDGTPLANKFLALDVNNKLILSETVDNTTASNFPGTNYKWFMGKVGNDLEFRSFDSGLNINIGTIASEFVFSLANTLNQIQQINPNPPRSPGAITFEPNNLELRIGSENIYLDNLDILNTAQFMVLDPAGKIGKANAVTALFDTAGLGVGLSAGVSGEIARIKTLKPGRNIELTAGPLDVTIDLAVNLQDIFNINSTTPFPLTIYNSEINFPSIPVETWNTTRKNIWINSSHEICKGFSVNSISNAGTNSLISADTISTDGNLALKGLVAGSNISFSTSGTNITINGTASSGNIYNVDGQSTDTLRVFSGKTPGDINNKIAFNDVNLNLTNSLPYNSSYIGSTACPNMLCFADGGAYSKFIQAPYNYLSRTVDVPLAAGYGESTIFYQSTCSILTANIVWIFQVDIWQTDIALPQAFCGTWEFTVNSQLAPNIYYIKPKSCTAFNGTSPQNLIALEAYRTVSGLNPVWVLRLVNIGLGLTGPATTYKCFVKDSGPTIGKTVSAILGPGLVTPTNNYLNPPEMIFSSGIGFPPSLITNYNQVGKDIRINIFVQLATTSGNLSGTFAVRFNGVNVYQLNLRTQIAVNYAIVSGSRIIKMIDLIAGGAITLNSPLTITYFVTGTGLNGINQPYEIIYEYV